MVAGAVAITASGAVQLAVLGNITTFGDFEALDFDGEDLDLFIGEAGSIIGGISMGSGNDTLLGGRGADRLVGGDDTDTVD